MRCTATRSSRCGCELGDSSMWLHTSTISMEQKRLWLLFLPSVNPLLKEPARESSHLSRQVGRIRHLGRMRSARNPAQSRSTRRGAESSAFLECEPTKLRLVFSWFHEKCTKRASSIPMNSRGIAFVVNRETNNKFFLGGRVRCSGTMDVILRDNH